MICVSNEYLLLTISGVVGAREEGAVEGGLGVGVVETLGPALGAGDVWGLVCLAVMLPERPIACQHALT